MEIEQTPPTWRGLTTRYRQALRTMGADLPNCLPGEPAECGDNDIQHLTFYLAAITAWATIDIGRTYDTFGDDAITDINRHFANQHTYLTHSGERTLQIDDILAELSIAWQEHNR